MKFKKKKGITKVKIHTLGALNFEVEPGTSISHLEVEPEPGSRLHTTSGC